MICSVCEDTGTMSVSVDGIGYDGSRQEEPMRASCDNCTPNSPVYGYAWELSHNVNWVNEQVFLSRGNHVFLLSLDEFRSIGKEIEGHLVTNALAIEELKL